MSLAEKLNKITPSAPGLPCGIAKILAGLATEDRKALETVMGVRSVPGGISTLFSNEAKRLKIARFTQKCF